jgi:hypothetical protein
MMRAARQALGRASFRPADAGGGADHFTIINELHAAEAG